MQAVRASLNEEAYDGTRAQRNSETECGGFTGLDDLSARLIIVGVHRKGQGRMCKRRAGERGNRALRLGRKRHGSGLCLGLTVAISIAYEAFPLCDGCSTGWRDGARAVAGNL